MSELTFWVVRNGYLLQQIVFSGLCRSCRSTFTYSSVCSFIWHCTFSFQWRCGWIIGKWGRGGEPTAFWAESGVVITKGSKIWYSAPEIKVILDIYSASSTCYLWHVRWWRTADWSFLHREKCNHAATFSSLSPETFSYFCLLYCVPFYIMDMYLYFIQIVAIYLCLKISSIQVYIEPDFNLLCTYLCYEYFFLHSATICIFSVRVTVDFVISFDTFIRSFPRTLILDWSVRNVNG